MHVSFPHFYQFSSYWGIILVDGTEMNGKGKESELIASGFSIHRITVKIHIFALQPTL